MWEAIGAAVASSVLNEAFREDPIDPIRARDDATREARAQAEKNAELQREFAKHGIQWRVEDAKAAGLHPLYAIGGSGASFAPNPIVIPGVPQGGGERTFGQDLSSAVLRTVGATQRQAQDLQLKLLQAQVNKEEAMAAYYASQASRQGQAGLSASPFPEVAEPIGVPASADGGTFHNRSLVKPAEVISPDHLNPYRTAGAPSPGFTEFRIGKDGLRMLLPQSNEGPAESLESISWWMWPGILKLNSEHYGSRWIKDLAAQYVPGYSSLSDGVEMARNALSAGFEDMWKGTAWERAEALSRMGRGPTVSGRIRQR